MSVLTDDEILHIATDEAFGKIDEANDVWVGDDADSEKSLIRFARAVIAAWNTRTAPEPKP